MSRYNSKKNPHSEQTAVALKYNQDSDYAPVVVASGHGPVAEKIIEVADEHGVPIYRDDSTAAVLTMLKVGQGIPPELYQVVAGIYIEIINEANKIKKSKENILEQSAKAHSEKSLKDE